MRKVIIELEEIINEYSPKLESISENDLIAKINPIKWSKKETIGHLIDSAQNNIRRFIISQYENNPKIIYQQDSWVAIQNYQNYPSDELIVLWALLNRHIIVILKKMPPVKFGNTCNTGIASEELHTLQWLAEDYIKHLLHHLKQIC